MASGLTPAESRIAKALKAQFPNASVELDTDGVIVAHMQGCSIYVSDTQVQCEMDFTVSYDSAKPLGGRSLHTTLMRLGSIRIGINNMRAI